MRDALRRERAQDQVALALTPKPRAKIGAHARRRPFCERRASTSRHGPSRRTLNPACARRLRHTASPSRCRAPLQADRPALRRDRAPTIRCALAAYGLTRSDWFRVRGQFRMMSGAACVVPLFNSVPLQASDRFRSFLRSRPNHRNSRRKPTPPLTALRLRVPRYPTRGTEIHPTDLEQRRSTAE